MLTAACLVVLVVLSSSAAGSGAGELSGTEQRQTRPSVSGVTLHVGDQAYAGAQALLTRPG